MKESAGQALQEALDLEAASIGLYRSGARESGVKSVRSLLLSILNQKTKRENRLKECLEAGRMRPGSWPELEAEPLPPLPSPSPDKEEFGILEAVVLLEGALHARYALLAAALADDEDADALLRNLSDEARKHSSWAQDHLDLLSLS